MSLTLGEQPGFTAIPSSSLATTTPLTVELFAMLAAAAMFAAVRNEQFYGYYANGETVVLPVSDADGYQYSRDELLYSWALYWSGSATAALEGTQEEPVKGATTGQGQLLQAGGNVDQSTGLVTTWASYYKTAQQDTNDGILLVITHAQRSR